MRRLALLLLALCALLAAGCGEGDVEQARDRVEERVRERVREQVAEVRREYEERRERYGRRFREVLAQFEQVLPEARRTSPTVRSRGRNEPQTIDAFLTDVLGSVDRYWTRTNAAADLPQPVVAYRWVPPGRVESTACGAPAGPDAAFYCPGDDTIYVSQSFAADLYAGVVRGLPGERAGYGRAAGDFAVAYVVAHEYAHNLQQELGVFDNVVGPSARPFELQADCLAGTWSNSVYEQGLLEPGDLGEATDAALAVGDFDVGNSQHHGTPEQRRDALLTGFRSGDPSMCAQFLARGIAR